MKSIYGIYSLVCIIIVMLLPFAEAIENHVVEEAYEKKINSISLSSFFKKIVGIVEIVFGITLSIYITQSLSLRVLPIILEIGLGPIVYVLVMFALLTIPIQILNGTCLLIQKQFSLGKWKTFFLTFVVFLIYILGNAISTSIIPRRLR